MTRISYDNKTFASVENSATGEVSSATRFHYHQKDDLVWAEYAGGAIRFGTLIAKIVEADCLEMRYQHLNENGELMTGKCFSTPDILADGRIRLHEKWWWSSDDLSKDKTYRRFSSFMLESFQRRHIRVDERSQIKSGKLKDFVASFQIFSSRLKFKAGREIFFLAPLCRLSS